jgi:hypothetical protein
MDSRGHAKLERRSPRRPSDLDQRAANLTDPWCEHAAIERVEPHASPPEACDGHSDAERRETPTSIEHH